MRPLRTPYRCAPWSIEYPDASGPPPPTFDAQTVAYVMLLITRISIDSDVGDRCDMPGVVVTARVATRFHPLRRYSMPADACDNPREEDTLMTHTSRTPLYRPIAMAIVAIAMTVSVLPAQAQRYGH